MRRIIFLILIFKINLIAGGFKISKYAGDFLSIGVGGRALGMGGAFISIANDVTAGYWNPAGLSLIDGVQLMLMHDEKFAGVINYDYFGFAFPYSDESSAGISIIRLGVDDIPYTVEAWIDNNKNNIFDGEDRLDVNKITYFSSADWILIFSYSRFQSDKFSFGGSAKLIYRKIGGNVGVGLGFDFGVRYKISRFTFGGILRDITSTLVAWDTGRNEIIIPSLGVGGSYEVEFLGGRFLPSIDFIFRFEERRESSLLWFGPASIDMNIGAEYMFRDIAGLRFGLTENGEFTIGAGVRIGKLDVDYSFAKFDSGPGNTHRISLKFTLVK
jgi:hypothetical protein